MSSGIIRTQYVINQKFVKHLENTELYELRISVGNNEYRTVLFTIDAQSFMECKRLILLNSFLKKSEKQYRAEIETAQRLLKKYMED